MKLILTSTVSGLGDPGDIVEVADGYGRNYLLPRRLAIVATAGAEKQVSQIKRARDTRSVRDLSHAREIKASLESLAVSLPVRAGQGGRLFGSVSAGDVVAAVRAAGGPELDRKRVQLGNPIKSVGRHAVTVAIHPEVSATVNVDVVPAS